MYENNIHYIYCENINKYVFLLRIKQQILGHTSKVYANVVFSRIYVISYKIVSKIWN